MHGIDAALDRGGTLDRGGKAPSRKRPAYLVPPTHSSQSKRVKTGSSSSNPLTSDSTDNRLAGRKKAELWFNQSNDSGAQKQDIPFVDNDPPFYFKRNDSDESSIQAHRSDASMHSGQAKIGPTAPTASLLAQMNARDNDNDSEDFRSVIDDLTVQNKKLRKKLKKYERLHCSHLQKEKLFEVRIHGLAAHRRRQLEDTLRSFASSIDEDESHGSARHHHHHHYVTAKSSAPQVGFNASYHHHHHHHHHPADGKPSSSSSGSRPLVDSAYASMSGTGSLPNVTHPNNNGTSAQQNVKSFLHDIPEALMPKSVIPMSDKSRSKLVVRRLEQLFTGRGAPAQRPAQSHQQQEVSTAAAEAERSKIEACGKRVWREGTREAHMLPSGTDLKMDVMDDAPASANTHRSDSSEGLDGSGGARLVGVTAPATSSTTTTTTTTTTNTQQTAALQPRRRSRSPEQRPTRPLDLDLHRAQVPADNIEYIRHLGLASPTAGAHPSAPGSSDDGWVYLNLLTSMAQLHTLNVTPDFVRKALTEVASTLRLSSDGTKVKWLGDTAEGTRLSSDGDESDQLQPAQAQWKSPEDASLDASKRGSFTEASSSKDESGNLNPAAPAALDTAETRTPTAAKRRLVNVETSSPTDTFHYKPLFYHAENSEDDDESGIGSLDESDDSLDFDTGMNSSSAAIAERQARLRPRNRDIGPIIFYNRAKFCTDLGGDAGGEESAYNAVAYDRCTRQPIGSSRESEEPPPTTTTTTSERDRDESPSAAVKCPVQQSSPASRRREISSIHRHRSYYLQSEPSALDDAASSTTSNLEKQSRTSALDMEDLITSISSCAASPARPPPAPIELEASGLGGVQPGDNFVVQVQTRHGRPASTSPVRGGGARAAGRASTREARVRKGALPHLSRAFDKLAGNAATATATTAATTAGGGGGGGAGEMHTDNDNDDVEAAVSGTATAEVISAVRLPLEPSQLPPPSFICLPFTSSESENGEHDEFETTLDSLRDESAGAIGGRAATTEGDRIETSGDPTAAATNSSDRVFARAVGGAAGAHGDAAFDRMNPAARRGHGLGHDDRSRVIRSFVGTRNGNGNGNGDARGGSSSAEGVHRQGARNSARDGSGSRASAEVSNDTENKESSYNTSFEEETAPQQQARRIPHMPQAAADLLTSRRLIPRHQLYAQYLQHDHNLRSQHAKVHSSSASDTGRSRRRCQRRHARGSAASSSSSSSSCSSSSSSIDLLAHARMQDPHAVQRLQREWERNNHTTATDATTSGNNSSSAESSSAATASAEQSNDEKHVSRPTPRSGRNDATATPQQEAQADQGRRRSGRLAIKASNASPSPPAIPTGAAALSEQAVVSEPASDSDAAPEAGHPTVQQTKASSLGKATTITPRAPRAKVVSPRASRRGSKALSAKSKGRGKGPTAGVEVDEEAGHGESDVDSMSVDRDESVAY